jgi:hypothetical protein
METIKIKEVCPTSTLELIKRNYLLLDVREENEFNQFSFDVPRVFTHSCKSISGSNQRNS